MASSAVQGSTNADFSAAQSESVGRNSYNFSSMALHDLLIVEICAGTARLTKTARQKGFRGLAIDKSKSRGCGTEIMILDLTLEQDLNILLQILKAESFELHLFLFHLLVVRRVKQESGQ